MRRWLLFILVLLAAAAPQARGYVQALEEHVSLNSQPATLNRVYNYGLDLISQRDAGGTVYYFIYDGLGSTRLLTTTNAAVANVFAYDAYGTLIASNGVPQTVYLYCGEQFDPQLGFYYLRARYLNTGTGRFWTRDSFEGNPQDPLSLHKYLYCHADPVNRVDPSGQFTLTEAAIVNQGIVALLRGSELKKKAMIIPLLVVTGYGVASFTLPHGVVKLEGDFGKVHLRDALAVLRLIRISQENSVRRIEFLGHGTMSSVYIGCIGAKQDFRLGGTAQYNGQEGYQLLLAEEDVSGDMRRVLIPGAKVILSSCSSACDVSDVGSGGFIVNFAQEVSRALWGKNIEVHGWSGIVVGGDAYFLNYRIAALSQEHVYIDGRRLK